MSTKPDSIHLPSFKGIKKYKDAAGKWGLWVMATSMFFLCLVFGVAGILQVYLERMLDIGYSTAHISMMFWFKVALFFGVVFLAGAITTVWHLFTLKEVPIEG